MTGDCFEFESVITARSYDKYDYSVVYLPDDLQASVSFPGGSPLRIDAEVNGVAISGALMPYQGRRYLLLSKKFLKRLKAGLGDRVFVRFTIADQDAVDIPEELRTALEAHGKAAGLWDQLTPGKRRGHAYQIASAKKRETREKRIEELIETLLATE